MTNFEHGLSQQELQQARNQYSNQMGNCTSLGRLDAAGLPIQMKMSFEQWLQVWIDSGKYHLRGCRKGCYVMARKDDLGHYEVGNVEIIQTEENVSFAHKGEKHHMFGKLIPAVESGNFKGTTIATNLATGEQIFLDGKKSIVAAGFNPGHVSQCILGKYGKHNVHLGHRFHRIPS